MTTEEMINSLDEGDIEAAAEVSPLVHFTTYSRLYNKKNQVEQPKANVLQRRINEALLVLMALGCAVRILVTKIRQCGGSTYCLHIGYHLARTRKIDALITADVASNSNKMIGRLGDTGKLDSFPWVNNFRQVQGRMSITNGSEFAIDSAERPNAGVSRTRQFFLASETPKWPRTSAKNDAKVMAAIMPSIPSEPGTIVISEGTPNGASGWQYEMWQKASWLGDFVRQFKAGNTTPGNGWVKVFAAWFEFEENRTKATDVQVEHIKSTFTRSELEGIQNYDWDMEQLLWRRNTIASECGGSEEAFAEYYPSDDESCWLTSGRPRFDQIALSKMRKEDAALNPETGRLLLQSDGETVNYSMDPTGNGDILIIEHPREGCRYSVICDPATGEDQTETNDPDHHSIVVMRGPYITPQGMEVKAAVVARVKAPFTGDGDLCASHIANLSAYYGECIIILEVNMGLHILTYLKLRGCHIYQREVFDEFDRAKPRLMYGFKTKDRATKKMLTDCLSIAIREQGIRLNFPGIHDQCRVFMIKANGEECAPAGFHDDDVISVAMGMYTIGSATLYVPKMRRRKLPRDYRDWERVSGGYKA